MDKKEFILTLLGMGNINIHFDATNLNCIVPEKFKTNIGLIFELGYDMAIPMQNFDIDETTLYVTLSFNRTSFDCEVPLNCIYIVSLVGTTNGFVWKEDIPKQHPFNLKEENFKKQKIKDNLKKSFKVISNNDIKESQKSKAPLRLVT